MTPMETQTAAETIRWRAVWVGLILALAICALTPFNNVYRQGTLLGGGHFPLAPFFFFLWLTFLMVLAGKILRRRSLMTGREMLFSWVLMVVGSGIAYTGLARTFFSNLTVPFHFATVGNRWAEVIEPLLPKALYPRDPQAIAVMYDGLKGGRDMSWFEVLAGIPWAAWLTPLLTWGGFILLSYLVMICLVNIFSRQWLVNERMNFPLLRVPQMFEEAVDEGWLKSLLINYFFLVGLAVPVILHTFNGLSFYYPSVPQLPTQVLAGSYFPKYGLFSAFHDLNIYFYPAFIGFAFLTSRQISFSFWAFFILGGLIIGALGFLGYNIPTAALGVTFGPHLTRPEETQMIGAYGVFFLFILWLARYHLLDVLKQAFGLKKLDEKETEWMNLRVSFWGFALGALGIIAWAVYFGLPILVAVLVIGAFFMVTLVASRVICQGGIAYFTLTAAPMDGLLFIFGPGFFTNAGLAVSAAMQKVLFVDLRESLMPSLFHTSKISQNAGNKRVVLIGLSLTIIGAVIVSFLAMLALCYKFGIRELGLDWATRTTVTITENVRTLIESPTPPADWVRIFSIAGAVFMLAMVICYHRFYWWPIHPIGYLTAYSSSMQILWFSFFVGWLANSLCMRYGGVVLFRKLRLFFMGLIVGDLLMGGIWAVVGLFADASYQVLPN